MTEQLSKWQQGRPFDVRDREKRGFTKNKELRDLRSTAEQLDDEENRSNRSERQASAEQSQRRSIAFAVGCRVMNLINSPPPQPRDRDLGISNGWVEMLARCSTISREPLMPSWLNCSTVRRNANRLSSPRLNPVRKDREAPVVPNRRPKPSRRRWHPEQKPFEGINAGRCVPPPSLARTWRSSATHPNEDPAPPARPRNRSRPSWRLARDQRDWAKANRKERRNRPRITSDIQYATGPRSRRACSPSSINSPRTSTPSLRQPRKAARCETTQAAFTTTESSSPT